MSLVALSEEESPKSPYFLTIDTHGFWKPNLGPPQEQQVLLTAEPSLQS